MVGRKLQLRKVSHRLKDSVLDYGSLSEIRVAPSVSGLITLFGKTVVVISCTLGERKAQIPLPRIGELYERADATNVFVLSCGWDWKAKGGRDYSKE